MKAAAGAGHSIEFADLYAEEFDPIVREVDEPDWLDPEKTYSPEVMKEMERIKRNEATVMFFPIWWWSMPAMLKGWVDRVWNHGFAYGETTYPHQHVLMVGVAGVDEASYQKRAYDKALEIQLDVGISEYCAIEHHGLVVFYDTLAKDQTQFEKDDQATELLGKNFPEFVTNL